jgi:hypothetical protein
MGGAMTARKAMKEKEKRRDKSLENVFLAW